jgi:tetratricopeptide (TPR) repeat protein
MSFAPGLAAALAFLVIGACLASPLSPLIQWVGKATAHFAIYTKGLNAEGQELLGHLETARLFFERSGWASRDLKLPLSILAFSTPQEFDTYRFNPGAFAFYQRTHEGDFVLMRALEPDHYSVAVHEYTHFVVEHSGLKLPLWLNEGLADFYSTLQYRNAQALVGTPPPGREDSLLRRGWIDWSTLAAVDANSPYYRQPEKMLAFYAQSWALVHVLALDPAYAGKFQSFLGAMSGTSKAEDVFPAVYHKTLQEVGHEVEENVKTKSLEPQGVNIDIRPGILQTADIADAPKQAEFALANVQAADPNALPQAKARLAALAAKYPDDPRSEEALGFLLMRSGAKSEAEQHFARALRANSSNPDVFFALAHLKLAHGGSSEEAINLLRRGLAVDPTNYNALLELGFAATKNDQFDVAVDALVKIKEPKPEHVFVIAYDLAYCLSELHQNARARAYAEQALKKAATPGDREQATGLLRFIGQDSPREVATYE